MLNLMVAGSIAALMLDPSAVSVAGQPGDAEITVDVVSYAGSGCPPGSAVVEVNPEETTFTVKYSEYVAQAGADIPRTDFRKNCQLTVDVVVPPGQTYAVVTADYRGYAYLEPGATGLQKANYYFQGMPETQSTEQGFTGPLDDNWQVSETADLAVYAPCEETRFLNINTELRVNRGTSDPETVSLMTMDSQDHNIDTTYQLDLKECDEVAQDPAPGK